MKVKLLRLLMIVVSIVLLAAPLVGSAVGPVADTAAQAGNGDNISSATALGWRPASRPWTREEMLAAKPYPLPEREGGPLLEALLSETEPAGEPGLIPGGAPLDAAGITVHASEGEEVFSVVIPLGYTYPAPFTRYNNFSAYTVFPYKTVGKLFFTQYGVNYVCSAASIGNYAIWTAGHCVHAGNGLYSGWSYNVVFVPAYKNGSAPYGQWTEYNLWTKTAWYNSGDLANDMGGAILHTNTAGQKISQVVGWLGFAYNQSRVQHWFDIGYPAASPFTGGLQVICAASHAYNDYSETPATVGIGCDMTGGCSGGPWILKFSGGAGATNYLNGENSYRYDNHPKELFSPYFDNRAKSLWDALQADHP